MPRVRVAAEPHPRDPPPANVRISAFEALACLLQSRRGMNAKSLRPFLLSSLLLAGALAPRAAFAGAEPEEFYQPRAEIRDEALRGVIGVVTIGMGPEPRGELPTYAPRRDGFELVGALTLDQMHAISGADEEVASVRRFPVLARRGEYLLTVVDVRSNTRVWIREHEWRGPEDFVIFDDLERALVGASVDVLALSRGGTPKLYRAPSPSARVTRRAPPPPMEALRVMRVEGDFAQVGLFRGLGEEFEPVGWVRIRDERGLLVAWPIPTDDC